MKRVHVAGIRMEVPTSSPVLLLKVDDESTHIPIWIGAPEAAAIAMMADDVESARPLTHDLILDVASASGRSLARAEITALREDVFEAALVFDDGGRVDSRASDAIALALRAHVDIFVDDDVVAEAGEDIGGEDEEELARFREFLDHVSAEDFDERDA